MFDYCATCGRMIVGLEATIDGVAYCHPADWEQPTCYMLKQWNDAMDKTPDHLALFHD